MEERKSTCSFVLFACLSVAQSVVAANPSVVYDSLTNGSILGGGYILGTDHVGEILSLSGTSRRVSQIDFALKEFTILDSELDFRVALWSAEGIPGELIWISPVQHTELTARVPKIVSVDVPYVSVPNTLGWSVVEVFSTNSPGLPASSLPTVGTSNAVMYQTYGVWSSIPWNDGALGVRITAVSEPTNTLLLLLGTMYLLIFRPSGLRI